MMSLWKKIAAQTSLQIFAYTACQEDLKNVDTPDFALGGLRYVQLPLLQLKETNFPLNFQRLHRPCFSCSSSNSACL